MISLPRHLGFLFFFNDTATTEIYTLSLHDALPIYGRRRRRDLLRLPDRGRVHGRGPHRRSEEHTSELQSRLHLVCRLLLEKKKLGEQAWPAFAEHASEAVPSHSRREFFRLRPLPES